MANKYLMTLDDYSRLNRYKRLNTLYKRLSIALVFAILYLLFPNTSNAASCWQDRGSYYHTTYQANFQGLTDDAGTVDSCSGVLLLTAQEYGTMKAKADMAENADIDPLDIAESFTWGFGTYITFWWLSFCIKTARMTIKKL